MIIIWPLLLLAAVGLVAYTSRAAVDRGRSRIGWGALSIIAGFVGQIIGVLLFGWAARGDATSFSIAGVMFGVVATLVGPVSGMLAVLGLLRGLPERVPKLRGSRWPMHRMSSKDAPGGDCLLSIENGRVLLGDGTTIEPQALTEIAVDGECLRLVWAGHSVLLMPAGAGQTARVRAKRSLALEKLLRQLREKGGGGARS